MPNELYDEFLKDPHIIASHYNKYGEKIIDNSASSDGELIHIINPDPKNIFGVDTFQRPVKTISLDQLKRFRIVSEDGLADNTKIYYGDELINGISQVSISIDAETNLVLGTFTVLAPICNLTIPRNHVRVEEDPTFPEMEGLANTIQNALKGFKDEHCTIPKEDFNQNSVT